jgi:hypothetical protein
MVMAISWKASRAHALGGRAVRRLDGLHAVSRSPGDHANGKDFALTRALFTEEATYLQSQNDWSSTGWKIAYSPWGMAAHPLGNRPARGAWEGYTGGDHHRGADCDLLHHQSGRSAFPERRFWIILLSLLY